MAITTTPQDENPTFEDVLKTSTQNMHLNYAYFDTGNHACLASLSDDVQRDFIQVIGSYCIAKIGILLDVEIADISPLLSVRINEGLHMSYSEEQNEIVIGTHWPFRSCITSSQGFDHFIISFLEAISEEVSHYYRAILTPGDEELNCEIQLAQVDEFFGFLGRRAVFQEMTDEERAAFYFDVDPAKFWSDPNSIDGMSDIMDKLRNRYKYRYLLLQSEYKDYLEHWPAYIEASRMDLSTIGWRKLFTLGSRQIYESRIKENELIK